MAKKIRYLEEDPALTRIGIRRTIVRIGTWYLGVLALFLLTWWLTQGLTPARGSDPLDPLTGQGTLPSISEMTGYIRNASTLWVEALLQMTAAFLLVIPLAVTYVRTRTRAKYDHSLVQTVIGLPLGVAAVLMMVRDSLALAFGLAGVVAAVRFRNSLRESGDAVYIFTAIIIGFAAGIQSLGIAFILSVLFCLHEIWAWQAKVVDPSGERLRRVCVGDLDEIRTIRAEAIAQLEERSEVRASLPQLPGPVMLDPVDDVDIAVPLTDEREQRLRVVANDLIGAQRVVAAVLDKRSKRWSLLSRELGMGSLGVLEYQVRFRKKEGADLVGDRIRSQSKSAVRALQWLAPLPESDGASA